MSMRGLTLFISDLRALRSRDQELPRINRELANIRTKFKDGNITGYDRKKYVAKLMYIYILGYQVDVGLMEAVHLLGSNKYSEKQIGYIAVALFFTESHELLPLVINSIRKDLDSTNEVFQCLALCAIANLGGKELAASLASDVYKILVTPMDRHFVQRKAALTLLRLFRKSPDSVLASDWAPKIIDLLNHANAGVALSVASLILALSQSHQDAYQPAVGVAVERLHQICIDRDLSHEYLYYKVPIPWLQVKVLRLVQYFPPPTESAVRSRLTACIEKTLMASRETVRSSNQSAAQSAILFEAINTAIHLDSTSQLVQQSAELLTTYLSSKDANLRYLACETLVHLASALPDLTVVQNSEETVIAMLKDRDISIRRAALDLLYAMCDTSNARSIVTELLQYLTTSDYGLREELVLKIAILSENFASELEWYVDVNLQLISVAGDHVNEDIWYRVVRMVINNPSIQEYATRTVLQYLKSAVCHEKTLKVGGHILGECGHLIADDPGCAPIDQLTALHLKFGTTTYSTRALILTTYLKFVNLFPEIRKQVLGIFEGLTNNLDIEIQQRACEYLAILQTSPAEGGGILEVVCEEMPPFTSNHNPLLEQLEKKFGETEDKRTWGLRKQDSDKRSIPIASKSPTLSPTNPAKAPPQANLLDDLIGLQHSQPPNTTNINQEDFFVEAQNPDIATLHRFAASNSCLLYDVADLQIGFKCQFSNTHGEVTIFVGNRGGPSTLQLSPYAPDGCTLKVGNFDHMLQPGAQLIVPLNFVASAPYSQLPQISLAVAGRRFGLFLPLPLSRFCAPVHMTNGDFFARWKFLAGAPKEASIVQKLAHAVDFGTFGESMGLKKLDGVDPKPNNFVGCGICHFETAKVGVLVRVEIEAEMFRLTVRSTNELVTKSFLDTFMGLCA